MPTPTHKTFCGFGAYAIDVRNPAATVIFAVSHVSELQRKSFSPRRLFTVNPSERLNWGLWNDEVDVIEVDTTGVDKQNQELEDQMSGYSVTENQHIALNVLTVGPDFPWGERAHVGAVYMRHDIFYKGVLPTLVGSDGKPRWPYAGDGGYRYMSSAARNGESVRRYHGFHATVMGRVDAGLQILVRTYQPERDVPIVVDVNDAATCDVAPELATDIQVPGQNPSPLLTSQSRDGEAGAIFLSFETCVSNDLRGPKLPPGGG